MAIPTNVSTVFNRIAGGGSGNIISSQLYTAISGSSRPNISVNLDGGISATNIVFPDKTGLLERLELIEKMLNIPQRNVALEQKYPQVAEAWKNFSQIAVAGQLEEIKEYKARYLYTVEQYTTWNDIDEK